MIVVRNVVHEFSKLQPALASEVPHVHHSASVRIPRCVLLVVCRQLVIHKPHDIVLIGGPCFPLFIPDRVEISSPHHQVTVPCHFKLWVDLYDALDGSFLDPKKIHDQNPFCSEWKTCCDKNACKNVFFYFLYRKNFYRKLKKKM